MWSTLITELSILLEAGDDPLTVYNTATKADGSFDEIAGTAYVPDPNFPGELLVKFPGGNKLNLSILLTIICIKIL